MASGIASNVKPNLASDDSMKPPLGRAEGPAEENNLNKAIRLNQRSYQTNAHRSPKGPISTVGMQAAPQANAQMRN